MKSRMLFFAFLLTFIVGCGSNLPHYADSPLIKKDTTKKLERENTLLAFVVEKISLKDLPHEKDALDNGFLATYKILTRVYGEYNRDTISFFVYDHYGIPAFSKFRHVLLFVSNHNNEFFYHEKYMYNDVYVTRDGRWAGPYTDDYGNLTDSTLGIRPVKIDFKYDVVYPVKDNDYDMGISYPEPYFKIEGRQAKAVYGNYLEELFLLKKYGTLSWRGLFGDTIPRFPEVEQDIIIDWGSDSTESD